MSKMRFTCISSLVLLLFVWRASGSESEELETEEEGLFPGPIKTTCPCGWANKAGGRIVGGSETQINEYPYMAGLTEMDQMFIYCGATLVSKKHAITAAHCVRGKNQANLGLYVGEHDVFTNTESTATELIKIAEVVEHPEYDIKTQKNDIAILVLAKEATFSRLVGPACLPAAKKDLVGQFVKVLGWGKMKNNGKQSRVLRKVNIKVVPLSNCADTYFEGAVSTTDPTQICTFTQKKDACKGDSGGPVLWLDPDTNMYTLVGVVSFGADCGKGDPAIQTDVAVYMPWITSTIAKSSEQVCKKKVSQDDKNISEYTLVGMLG